jgi:hypothetical protein
MSSLKYAMPINAVKRPLSIRNEDPRPSIMYSHRLLPFSVSRHEFHLQREDAFAWLFLISRAGNCDGGSADWTAFLVAGVEGLVQAFGAEHVALKRSA